MRLRLTLALALALIGWLAAAPATAGTALSVEHLGTRYAVFRLDKGEEQRLRFVWKRSDGNPYGSLSALQQDLAARGKRLVFATNGGIYSRELTPLGLYVEDGKTLAPLNRAEGGGNFFLKPNGVFLVTPKGAQVVETDRYRSSAKVRQAVQSGPMLTIGGRLNPRFIPGYDSRYVRNGVGVDRQGRAVFAISEDDVNFHDFATLFRDRLDCPNALYLDGHISQMYLPELGRPMPWPWRPLVTILALTRAPGD